MLVLTMARKDLQLVLLLLGIYGASANREAECIEVGYARSAGSILHQGFEATKGELLQKWAQEDADGVPTFSGLTQVLKNVTRTGELLESTSKTILGMIRKTRVGKRCPEDWLLKGLEKHVIPLMNIDKDLSEELGLVMSFRCMVGSPYPNVDGTCVNQESPDLGAIGAKFLRLQPAAAGKDGFSLRESVSGEKTLPSARAVANLLRNHLQKPPVTGVFGEWGHFIQRDSFSIPESPWAEDVDCCATPEVEDCAPIYLEKDDPDHSTIQCMSFKRSAKAQAILGHRETLSLVSTYLDATPVYGPTNEVAFSRKTGYFGYLKAPEKDEEETASGKKKEVKCAAPESFQGCFQLAEGDDWLENLRLLFVMEHNRIVDALAEINSHFDDSLLYNEARRITIAEYNHITFKEYLPVVMGEELVKKHSLNPGAEGPAAGYIKEVNPGILNSFAVASYRNPSMHTEWRKEWGPTEILESSHYSAVREDPYQDLLAMDIQRGRDQGMVGYLTWRRFCDSTHSYNTWEDLEKGLPKELVNDLKELYQDEIDDIDALVALLEKPDEEDGGIVGKTFTCLLADQFARLKTGNRLFWEHDSSLLTVEQRDFIKTSSLAKLLCRNTPVHAVPANSFLPPSDTNPLVTCSEIAADDLSPWKDTSLIEKMKEVKAAKEAEEKKQEESEEKASKKEEL